MRYTEIPLCEGIMLYAGEPSFNTSVGWFRTPEASAAAIENHRRLSSGAREAAPRVDEATACEQDRHAVSRDHLRWYIDAALAKGFSSETHPARIVYTNYRGETATRLIVPRRLWFGSTEWHPEAQWLLDALDVEKNEQRSFAVADISKWERA